MSTRNLRSWIPPLGVRSVLIAADRAKLVWAGLKARVELPPGVVGDWNEAAFDPSRNVALTG